MNFSTRLVGGEAIDWRSSTSFDAAACAVRADRRSTHAARGNTMKTTEAISADGANPRRGEPSTTSVHRRENPMRRLFAIITLSAGALALGACDKTPTSPPTPKVAPAQIETSSASGPAGDPSVPSADSVLVPADAAKADPALGRSNKSMTAAQESTAMPMPGQNNDHSAALGPAKRASAP